jgi:hypothetical protein
MEFRSLMQISHPLKQLRVAPGDEDVVPVQEHPAHNSFHMGGIFATCEDHFRESLAKGAVMIDLGITQVFVGQDA